MSILEPKEISNIIMMVIFVATFLGIFYFTYVAKVEEQIVAEEVDYIVDDLTSDLQLLLSDKQKDQIRSAINKIPRPDLSASDKSVNDHNSQVFWSAIKILSVGFVIGMIGIYMASQYWKFDLLELIKNNLIILVFVGITEYAFLNFFAKNYISADPNFVKRTVLNKLASIN